MRELIILSTAAMCLAIIFTLCYFAQLARLDLDFGMWFCVCIITAVIAFLCVLSLVILGMWAWDNQEKKCIEKIKKDLRHEG